MTAPADCSGAVHKTPTDGSCPCGRVTKVRAARPRLDPAITGEWMVDGEPTAAQAAALVQQMMGAGAVARLDLVHGALLAAFRAGRATERAEVQRLAEQHAAAFTAAMSRRAGEQAARADLPWTLQ